MATAEADIIKFLSDASRLHWDHVGEPYLLSLAQPEMKKRGIDYKAAIGVEKLSEFVRRTEGSGSYKIIRHPLQRAKIGIIPSNKDYDYENDLPPSNAEPVNSRRTPTKEKIVLDFLRLVSQLSEQDSSSIVIPVRVLAKLLKD